ncbi:MAG: CvpA family protein [Pseudomonadota bacterium]|nr:CvpA family protein [Pseudomonadota bacterium]
MYNGLLIDLIIITVLATAIASGISRGALREALSLGLWLAVIGAAVLHFERATAWLGLWIDDPAWRAWAAAIAILVAAAAVLGLVDRWLARREARRGRRGHDLLLGMVFGVLRGLLLILLVVVLFQRTPLPDRLAWSQSQLIGYAEVLALAARQRLPAELGRRIVLRDEIRPGRRVVLNQDSRGHYVAKVWLNGMPVQGLVDTGATAVMIPAHMQEKLGLVPGEAYPANTATGQVTARQTVIDAVKLGPIVLHDVEGALVPSTNDIVLLGMSLLLRLSFRQTVDGLLLEESRPEF